MISEKTLNKISKQDKNLAIEIANTLGYKIKAEGNRTLLMLKSEDPDQKLAAIKKVLEIAVNSLVAKAKTAENYDMEDALEKTHNRIVLHLNTLKKLSQQIK